jgi:hypothetical protein
MGNVIDVLRGKQVPKVNRRSPVLAVLLFVVVNAAFSYLVECRLPEPGCNDQGAATSYGLCIYQEGWLPHFVQGFMLFGIIAALFTGYAILTIDNIPFHATLWLLWSFIPPTWFLIEYFFLYPRYSKPNTFEAFEFGQETAAKLWAVGVVAVGAYLYHLVQKEVKKVSGSS